MKSRQPALLGHAAGLVPVDLADANDLLAEWGHYLGPCRRPFGASCWVLEVAGRAVSVAVGASTVSKTVGGYGRRVVVELARLCSCEPWATRPMLRLWREVAAPLWPYWPVKAAVAYSQSNRHQGDLYRWDGWRLAAEQPASGGGGSWSRSRDAGDVAAGPKRLWLWEYERQLGSV